MIERGKEIKRIISICVLLLLTMSFTTSAFASIEEPETGTTWEISEYDYIKCMQSKTDEELSKLGFSDEQIEELRNIDLAQIAYKIKNSSDEELIERGLNSQQINEIKNTNNEEIILRNTLGKCTYNMKAVKLEYNSKKKISYLKTKLTWNWSAVPIQTLIDEVAVTTNESFYRNENSSYNKTTINYYKDGKKSNTRKTITVNQDTNSAGTGVYSQIPMVNSYSDDKHKWYAMSGSMYVAWKKTGNIRTVNTAGNYGHMIVYAIPSVSFGKDGLTINFKPVVSFMHGNEDTDSIDR